MGAPFADSAPEVVAEADCPEEVAAALEALLVDSAPDYEDDDDAAAAVEEPPIPDPEAAAPVWEETTPVVVPVTPMLDAAPTTKLR